ncbi:hypothetical protein TNCV_3072491, partial [Trichonephila clavipes]
MEERSRHEKCDTSVPVPACGINDDLFACGYECRFSSILDCSCVVPSTNLK